jgi:hypothetical protein
MSYTLARLYYILGWEDQMQVDFLVLADAATAAEGKLYIHGAGWDTLFAASFPVQHPLLAAAVRLRVPWTATNQPHSLELDVIDEDGASILPDPPGVLRGEINVGRPPNLEVGQDQVMPLTFSIRGLTFERAGGNSVVFRIDGSEEARSPFRVQALPGSA